MDIKKTGLSQKTIDDTMECLRENCITLNEQKLFDDGIEIIKAAVSICEQLLDIDADIIINNCRIIKIVFSKNKNVIETIEL